MRHRTHRVVLTAFLALNLKSETEDQLAAPLCRARVVMNAWPTSRTVTPWKFKKERVQMKRLLMFSLVCTIAGGFAASEASAARKKVKVQAVRTAMKRLDDAIPPPTPDAISLRVPGPRYQESDIPPAPATAASPAPMPVAPIPSVPMQPNLTPVAEAPAVPLFECVRYLGKPRIAPCAVTKTIVIKDPCQTRCDCCQKCVAINICVPGCACECIKSNKLGNRIVYDYGKHKVIVRILRGRVLVVYV